MTVSIEILHKVLDYDQDTGIFTWKMRGPELFKDGKMKAQQKANIWNGHYAHKEALNVVNKDGYLRGCIFYKEVLAHRAAIAIVDGEWPEQCDHINGVRDDNRYVNLRSVTGATNALNRRVGSNNSSGVTGVCWDKRSCSWKAQITINRVRTVLGYFSSIDEAAKVRLAAENRLGFHENNGKTFKKGMDTITI